MAIPWQDADRTAESLAAPSRAGQPGKILEMPPSPVALFRPGETRAAPSTGSGERILLC
jgi:hypothetical protein